MTRKKWNRLRRQRPELFQGMAYTGWERMSKEAQVRIRERSKAEIIGILTGWKLSEETLCSSGQKITIQNSNKACCENANIAGSETEN